MPQDVTEYTVFCGAPGDVQEHIDLIQGVVEDINDGIGQERGVRFDVTRGEDAPSESGQDPQDIINRLLEDSDFFLGLMWTTFGAPTPRAGSGTEEEYRMALDMFHKEDIQDVMFFFNQNLDGVTMGDVDPSQLQKVEEFRAEMDETLYRTYESPEELEDKARKTLREKVRQISEERERERCPREEESDENGGDDESEDEPEGVFDLMEEGDSSLSKTTGHVQSMATEIQDLGDRVGEETAKLTSGNPSADEVKSALNKISGIFDEFVGNINPELSEAQPSFEESMSSYLRAMEIIRQDFDPEDVQDELQDPYEDLRELLQAMDFTLDNISSLRRTAEELPRLTSDFTRSRNNLVTCLNGVENFLKTGIEDTRKVTGEMEEILEV